MTGAYVVGLALLLAIAFGFFRRAVDGRVRPAPAGSPITSAIGDGLGGTATFVQFSSEACAPCRVTARVLGEVSAAAEGVAHIEIDAGRRLDLVNELGITRTPTVLLLDGAGVVRNRIVGTPRRQDVLAALDGLRPPAIDKRPLGVAS